MLRFVSFLVFMMGVAAAVLGWAIMTNNVDKIQIGGDKTKITQVTREVWTPEPAAVEAYESDASYTYEETSDDYANAAPSDQSAAAYEEAAPQPSTMPAPVMSEAAPDKPAAAAQRSRSLQVEEPMFEATVSPGFSGSSESPAFEEVISNPASMEDVMSIEPAAGMAMPEKSAEEIFLESLRTVPIAHETPNSAGYKQAFDVVLAIDATGDDTAVDALPGRGGTVVEGTTQVSDQVEARLTGAAFGIVDNSPGVQKMSPITENTWRWSVTPLKAGEHDLVFEIFAIDGDVATPLRTYRDTVTVEVKGIGHAVAFADQTNPLFVLLGGLGSAIAGLFGVFSFFRKKRA